MKVSVSKIKVHYSFKNDKGFDTIMTDLASMKSQVVNHRVLYYDQYYIYLPI